MIQPNRNSSSEDYRYGFGGYEADHEVSGDGNAYTSHFRQYDPRLGRWKTTDPVIHPSRSAYEAMDGNPIRHSDPLGDNVPFAPAAALASGASVVGGCAANGISMAFSATSLAISVANQAGGLANNHMNRPNLGGGGEGKKQSSHELKEKEANDGKGKEGDYFIDNSKRRFTKSETGEFYETFDSQDKDEYHLNEGIPVYGDGTYHEVMNSRFISLAVKFSFRTSPKFAIGTVVRALQIFHDLYEALSFSSETPKGVTNSNGDKERSPASEHPIVPDTTLEFTTPYLRNKGYAKEIKSIKWPKKTAIDSIEKYKKHGFKFQ